MTGISDWFENNWIDLARLLVQLAIFAAIVRYGRKLLATLRASQEQVGALLRLSVSSDTAAERLAPMEPERLDVPEPPAPVRENASSWLQTPVRSNSVSPWRKMVRWLKEPARR